MWPFKPKETDNPHVNSLVDWLCDMAVHPEMWGFRCQDWTKLETLTELSINPKDGSTTPQDPGDTQVSIILSGELRVKRFSYSVKHQSGEPQYAWYVIPITMHQQNRLKDVWNTVFSRLAIRQIVCRYETMGITDSVKQLPALPDLDRYAGFKEKAKLENKAIMVDTQRLAFAKTTDSANDQFRADCVVDIEAGKVTKNKYGPVDPNHTESADDQPCDMGY